MRARATKKQRQNRKRPIQPTRPDPPNPTDLRTLVQRQFAPVASAYVHSTTHAHGADLPRMLELAAPTGRERVLDVATGGGHTALAFAPQVRHTIAIDLTFEMLTAARQHLAAHGGRRVDYCRAVAEALPFASQSFDLVTCRVAAHHFADVRAFVAESARVLRPGGRLLVSDHLGLDDTDLDAFMDRFERWRDPGHVRAYRFAEWHDFCQEAGLSVVHTEEFPREPYAFDSWTARIRMPEAERAALERWLLAAPARFRECFEITEQDGHVVSLRSVFGIIVAHKPVLPVVGDA
ncbi:MAG: methyltransferase domain-containing protein [Chloroflexaceae bacterium]|nr:methyltransferase domain-containing protein [Chloroflexaceae bacterium]